MDGLSVTAGIIALVQLTGSVIAYLNDVKEAPKECSQCMQELANSNALLVTLRNRLNDSSPGQPWYDEVAAFVTGAPFDQYKQALQSLLEKVNPSSKKQKLTMRLLWTFVKDDVARILLRAERLKSLVSIALEMDHL